MVTRTRRVLAVLLGIAMLVALVVQIVRDNHDLQMKKAETFQSTTK